MVKRETRSNDRKEKNLQEEEVIFKEKQPQLKSGKLMEFSFRVYFQTLLLLLDCLDLTLEDNVQQVANRQFGRQLTSTWIPSLGFFR